MPREAGGVSFREVRPGDRDALIALDDAAMAPYGLGGRRRPDLMDACAVYAAPTAVLLVGESGGAVVAMCGLLPEGPALARLKRLRVDPGWRRQGIASRLVALLEERAQVVGYAGIMLRVTSRQTEALAFYPRLGYRRSREEAGDGFRMIHFAKALPRRPVAESIV